MTKCNICGCDVGSIKGAMANHKRWNHIEVKNYKCENCDGCFRGITAYKCHIKHCAGIKICEKWICHLCGYEIKSNRNKHLKYCNGRGPRRKREKIGSLKGKTYVELFGEERAKELIEKKSATMRSRIKNWDLMSDEQKNLFRSERSRDMKKRYENGWQSKAGRCKKIWYESPIAGRISVDGFWELIVAMYFDLKKYDWARNTKRFGYIHLNGKESKYTPDFWVKDFESYVEVKGYEDELTKCKLRQFNEPIQIWKKQKIKEIEKEVGITVRQLKKQYKDKLLE